MAWTKEEKAAYDKSWRLANKEKKAADSKAWRLANKEKKAADNKAWHLANPEYNKKRAVYKKAWQKANQEKSAASTRAWQKANPEKLSAAKQKHLLKLNLANKNISQRTLRAWSAQVRARDTACIYCGSTSNLHAHHILSKSKHPDHALFLNNGITLCEVCHIQEHILNGDI